MSDNPETPQGEEERGIETPTSPGRILPQGFEEVESFYLALDLSEDERDSLIIAGYDSLDTLWDMEESAFSELELRIIIKQRLSLFLQYHDEHDEELERDRFLSINTSVLRKWQRQHRQSQRFEIPRESTESSSVTQRTTNDPRTIDIVLDAQRK